MCLCGLFAMFQCSTFVMLLFVMEDATAKALQDERFDNEVQPFPLDSSVVNMSEWTGLMALAKDQDS